MFELAIDTAGASMSVALRAGAPAAPDDGPAVDPAPAFSTAYDPVITSLSRPAGRGQAEGVLGLVDELMAEAGADYNQLSRIITSVGPGSFTGVRVGVALAKGLALASGARLFGAAQTLLIGHGFWRSCLADTSSLKNSTTLEEAGSGDRAASGQGPVWAVCIAGGRGDFFMQVFSIRQGGFCPLGQPEQVMEDEVPSYLERWAVTTIAGPDAQGPEALLKSSIAFQHVSVSAVDFFAIKDCLLREGAGVKPLYLRAPDAKPQQGKALKRSFS